jgi:hypothetical protein
MIRARIALAFGLTLAACASARAQTTLPGAQSTFVNVDAGGTIELADGTTLMIPADFLPRSGLVTLSVVDRASSFTGPINMPDPQPASPVVVIRFSPAQQVPKSEMGPHFRQAKMTLRLPFSHSAATRADRTRIHLELASICGTNGKCLGLPLNPEQQSQDGVVVGLSRSFLLGDAPTDRFEVYSL